MRLEHDVTDHKYAGCEELVCQRCDDYAAGYVDGTVQGLDPDDAPRGRLRMCPVSGGRGAPDTPRTQRRTCSSPGLARSEGDDGA